MSSIDLTAHARMAAVPVNAGQHRCAPEAKPETVAG